MLLVCRFTDPGPEFPDRARRALELLTAQPGCMGGEVGRSVDEPGAWVLTARFASVDAYRRALSPFPVREHVVPLLAQAEPVPSTFETLAVGTDGTVELRPSLLA